MDPVRNIVRIGGTSTNKVVVVGVEGAVSEGIREPTPEGQREGLRNQQTGIGIPDLDGQHSGEAEVQVDWTILDHEGV